MQHSTIGAAHCLVRQPAVQPLGCHTIAAQPPFLSHLAHPPWPLESGIGRVLDAVTIARHMGLLQVLCSPTFASQQRTLLPCRLLRVSSSTYPPPALAPPTEKNPAASASESVYCSVSSQADLDFPRYTPPLVNSPSLQRPSCKSPSGLPSPKLLPEGGRRFGWSWRAKWRQSEPSINCSGCIAAMRKVGTRPVHIATRGSTPS